MLSIKNNSVVAIFLALMLAAMLWTGLSLRFFNPQANYAGVTFFREDVDFGVYFSGQGWIKPGKLLYDEGYAEYPPFALFYLTWPRLFTDNFEIYHWVLWFSNGVFFILAGILVWYLAKILQGNKVCWWLLFLPSVFYYSFNRFDIFPVFLVLFSLYLILKEHWRSGWLVYGLAVMTKVFPIILLPLYLYFFKKTQKNKVVNFCYAFLPVIALVVSSVVSGGWAAAVVPYLVQFRRLAEAGSLLFFIINILPAGYGGHSILQTIFSFMQLVLPLWWLIRSVVFKLPENERMVPLVIAALSLLLLINFNNFYSNQWWLWVLPFLILVMPAGKLWLVVLYDFLNYLQFPVIFETYGKLSYQFEFVVLVRSIIFLWLAFVLFQKIPKTWWKFSFNKI